MANDAELLADLLDGRLDPAQAPAEIAQLAELAGAVSEHITLVPPTLEFRTSLREELLQTAGAPGGAPSGGASPPGHGASGVGGGGAATSAGGTAATSAAAGIPAVVAAVAATAVLAASTWTVTTESVPGDPLYGLKQGIESLQLTIADDARDVELLVGFATQRLREAIGLADPVVVSGLLEESERLLDDALTLAVAQGHQVQDLLDSYASALVTLDSRTDDPAIQAELDQLMDDVGVTPPGPVGPALDPDRDNGDQPGDQPQEQPDDGMSEDPLDGPDDPLDELDDPLDEPDDPLDDPLDGPDDPLDELDDPLDGPDDPLDELDDPLEGPDDPLDELEETLEETTDTLGGGAPLLSA